MLPNTTPPLNGGQDVHQVQDMGEKQAPPSAKKIFAVAIPLIVGIGALAALSAAMGFLPIYVSIGLFGAASIGAHLPGLKTTLDKKSRALDLKYLRKSPFANARTLKEYEKNLKKDNNIRHVRIIPNFDGEARKDVHNVSSDSDIFRGSSYLVDGKSPMALNKEAHSELEKQIQDITKDDTKTSTILAVAKDEHDILMAHSKIKNIDQENYDELCKLYNKFALDSVQKYFKVEVEEGAKEKDIFQFCDQSIQDNLLMIPTFYYANLTLSISTCQAPEPNSAHAIYHLHTKGAMRGILEVSSLQKIQFGNVKTPLRDPLYFKPRAIIDFVNKKQTITWESPTPSKKEEVN